MAQDPVRWGGWSALASYCQNLNWLRGQSFPLSDMEWGGSIFEGEYRVHSARSRSIFSALVFFLFLSSRGGQWGFSTLPVLWLTPSALRRFTAIVLMTSLPGLPCHGLPGYCLTGWVVIYGSRTLASAGQSFLGTARATRARGDRLSVSKPRNSEPM